MLEVIDPQSFAVNLGKFLYSLNPDLDDAQVLSNVVDGAALFATRTGLPLLP